MYKGVLTKAHKVRLSAVIWLTLCLVTMSLIIEKVGLTSRLSIFQLRFPLEIRGLGSLLVALAMRHKVLWALLQK